MDYHNDRFLDHSLLFIHREQIIALLPANEIDCELHSHSGLTYGGLVLSEKCKIAMIDSIFESLIEYCKTLDFKTVIYKTIPIIYHKIQSVEDKYLLFKYGAELYRRDLTTSVLLKENSAYQTRRKRAINKAKDIDGVNVGESDNWTGYWRILRENLESRHNVQPVHTLDEIKLLQSRFPGSIELITAEINGNVHAGIVIYATDKVAHAQYIASDKFANLNGVLDLTFDYAINKYRSKEGIEWFDFGISTESDGKILNKGLMEFKEGFGGVGIIQDFYKLFVQ